jgi:hypothetical protein
MPPDQKVDANTMTKVSFAKEATKGEFTSVLLYRLQKKENIESSSQPNTDNMFTKDTSLQLLVIWKSDNIRDISVRALLIKHSDTITWNENILEKLHSMYLALLKNNDNIEDTWLLDDATVLMTALTWKFYGATMCTIKHMIDDGVQHCPTLITRLSI